MASMYKVLCGSVKGSRARLERSRVMQDSAVARALEDGYIMRLATLPLDGEPRKEDLRVER